MLPHNQENRSGLQTQADLHNLLDQMFLDPCLPAGRNNLLLCYSFFHRASPSFFRPLSGSFVFSYGKVKPLNFQVQEILHHFWNTTRNTKQYDKEHDNMARACKGKMLKEHLAKNTVAAGRQGFLSDPPESPTSRRVF